MFWYNDIWIITLIILIVVYILGKSKHLHLNSDLEMCRIPSQILISRLHFSIPNISTKILFQTQKHFFRYLPCVLRQYLYKDGHLLENDLQTPPLLPSKVAKLSFWYAKTEMYAKIVFRFFSFNKICIFKFRGLGDFSTI